MICICLNIPPNAWLLCPHWPGIRLTVVLPGNDVLKQLTTGHSIHTEGYKVSESLKIVFKTKQQQHINTILIYISF